jgi:hypothetical protein
MKGGNPNGMPKTLILSKLTIGNKLRSKLEGDQIKHLQCWTINPIEVNFLKMFKSKRNNKDKPNDMNVNKERKNTKGKSLSKHHNSQN